MDNKQLFNVSQIKNFEATRTNQNSPGTNQN